MATVYKLPTTFSPQLISYILITPLRYLFSNYTAQQGFVWNEDEKKRSIEIGHMNDFNKIPLQEMPRVLISRGGFGVSETSMTGSMASKLPNSETFGLESRTHKVFINGGATVIIEARAQGTCEMLTDIVFHFLLWSRQFICNFEGFKDFGKNMSISDCSPSKEDVNKFQTTISIPYMFEETWSTEEDGLKLRDFYFSMSHSVG